MQGRTVRASENTRILFWRPLLCGGVDESFDFGAAFVVGGVEVEVEEVVLAALADRRQLLVAGAVFEFEVFVGTFVAVDLHALEVYWDWLAEVCAGHHSAQAVVVVGHERGLVAWVLGLEAAYGGVYALARIHFAGKSSGSQEEGPWPCL